MKKVFKTMMIAFILAMIMPINAIGSPEIVAAKGNDTVRISSSKGRIEVTNDAKKLTTVINDRLNDTVLRTIDDSLGDKTENHAPIEFSATVDDNGVPASAIAIVAIVFLSIVLIVIAAIIGSYMHRRQKYRLVEKAIENNYPLPNGTFVNPQLGATKRGTSGKADWSNLRSGIAWCAWGVGITLFFLINGDPELSAIGLILIIIGAGRFFIAYKNNENMERTEDKNPNDPKTPSTPPPFNR